MPTLDMEIQRLIFFWPFLSMQWQSRSVGRRGDYPGPMSAAAGRVCTQVQSKSTFLPRHSKPLQLFFISMVYGVFHESHMQQHAAIMSNFSKYYKHLFLIIFTSIPFFASSNGSDCKDLDNFLWLLI